MDAIIPIFFLRSTRRQRLVGDRFIWGAFPLTVRQVSKLIAFPMTPRPELWLRFPQAGRFPPFPDIFLTRWATALCMSGCSIWQSSNRPKSYTIWEEILAFQFFLLPFNLLFFAHFANICREIPFLYFLMH